ncbi:MAG: aldehyde ferredoxin oxidoreductase, partial [Planctomycetales bacterium]|nr:aldehyde ferredoxin oxidoreductase [Planctomycetales bacterium]
LVVTGKSAHPVYLTILDGQAAFHDAAHLMGKVTGEVEAILKEELGDPKIEILQYGPAAENGVLFSSLVNMA